MVQSQCRRQFGGNWIAILARKQPKFPVFSLIIWELALRVVRYRLPPPPRFALAGYAWRSHVLAGILGESVSGVAQSA